ncbi:ATP-binding cassette domain-containing protein [Candidatus Saccharibacteria bacterium]|nr:ATP-binding cassette domain-containing protein [Candidatus Saccharibacteria bacterium]
MICLKNLCFKANRREILSELSLRVKPGEFVVITGPNGSGKSTFAKIIAGLERQSSGQIILDGEDISKLPITERAKKGIAFSFQQPVHFKGLTVRDLLQIAVTGQETFLDPGVIDFVGLLAEVGLDESYLDREIDKSLSGGELKRVEIASALARPAKLLIFDEPEAGIDIWSFDRLVKVFQKLRKRNCAIIVISHQKRLMAQADRIVVLKDGRIAKSGPADKMVAELEREEA